MAQRLGQFPFELIRLVWRAKRLPKAADDGIDRDRQRTIPLRGRAVWRIKAALEEQALAQIAKTDDRRLHLGEDKPIANRVAGLIEEKPGALLAAGDVELHDGPQEAS